MCTQSLDMPSTLTHVPALTTNLLAPTHTHEFYRTFRHSCIHSAPSHVRGAGDRTRSPVCVCVGVCVVVCACVLTRMIRARPTTVQVSSHQLQPSHTHTLGSDSCDLSVLYSPPLPAQRERGAGDLCAQSLGMQSTRTHLTPPTTNLPAHTHTHPTMYTHACTGDP
jgi:hypothetical protein